MKSHNKTTLMMVAGILCVALIIRTLWDIPEIAFREGSVVREPGYWVGPIIVGISIIIWYLGDRRRKKLEILKEDQYDRQWCSDCEAEAYVSENGYDTVIICGVCGTEEHRPDLSKGMRAYWKRKNSK